MSKNAPTLMAHHLSASSIVTSRLSVWYIHNKPGVSCPAFTYAVCTLHDADLKRRALFLRFQRLVEHEAGSLKLEHFLVWFGGRPRVIDTLADLVEAMRGVAVWLVFLLGPIWIGVMGGFLEDVEAERYKGFSDMMPYVLEHVYDALYSIVSIAEREKKIAATPQQRLRDLVAASFTNIKDHLSSAQLFDFALTSGSMRMLFQGGAAAAPSTPVRPVSTAPTTTPVATPGLSEGVCFGSLGGHYNVANSGCKTVGCARLHYERLPVGTTRAGLIGMLGGLREGSLRNGILEGIAVDPAFHA
jgi:hypothetical protein